MKLRQRLLLWLGATLLVLTAGVYLIVSRVTLASYLDLERADLRRNVLRVEDAIQQQSADFHESTVDWSDWDDTYRYMADRNPAFYQSNLSTLTLKADVILFVDEKGKYFASKTKKRLADVAEPDAKQLLQDLGTTDLLQRNTSNTKDFKGLVIHKSVPMIVSVRPIRDTAGIAKPRGRIIFGLYLDRVAMKEIGERTHLSTTLESDVSELSFATNPSGITTDVSNNQAVAYSVLHDLHGEPMRVIRVSQPRTIYAKGQESLNTLFTVLFIVSATLTLVTLVGFDVVVLSRLRSLSEQLKNMANHDDESYRVILGGSDEISGLATRFNALLSVIRARRRKIVEAHAELESTVRDLAASNAVLENAVEGIAHLSPTGAILSVNVAFARAFGYDAKEMFGINWPDIVALEDSCRCEAALRSVVHAAKEQLSIRGLRKDGSSFYQEATLIVSFDAWGNLDGFHLFVKDVTERRHLEMQIEHQAYHDALTQLPNRTMFVDRLQRACQRAQERSSGVSVIFLDMDNFKVINDSLGHEAGDRLLVAFADRLFQCVHSQAGLARIGGDEFTLLLEDKASIHHAEQLAQSILEEFQTPISFESNEVFVSVSMGISHAQAAACMPDELLRHADTAMYEAKANGKSDYAVFNSTMSRRAIDRLELEFGLRQAIENNEFVLQFQPIVNLQTRQISGMEALVRWEHPERGIIPPAAFIPIAEETGLINDIGAWVLRESCYELNHWRDTVCIPEEFRISINMSGRQLQRRDIVTEVESILMETRTNPNSVKIEITESIMMTDMDETIRKMKELKGLGVMLAMDDFGTGYSSMSSLSRFPLDTVKIDRCFVSRLGEPDANAVIAAIIMLAQSLDCDITAEGVEEIQQMLSLAQMGCSNAQGYLFDRPLNSTVARERLATSFGQKQLDAA